MISSRASQVRLGKINGGSKHLPISSPRFLRRMAVSERSNGTIIHESQAMDDFEATTSYPSLGNTIRPSSQANSSLALMPAIGSLTLSLTVIAMISTDPALADSTSNFSPHVQFDLAENQEFWGNVVRYGRYFVTVMLGTGYVMVRPIAGMFKNPVTGLLAIALVGGAVYGTKITLDAMLGLGGVAAIEYSSSNFM